MRIAQKSDLLEKFLAFIFLIIFFIFTFFFTFSNLKEIEDSFNKQRITFTKKIAHEVCDLIEKRIDISSKLSNLTAENSVAYAMVHLNDGSLLARSEGYALPVGIFETAEIKALKTDFLILTSFKDSSERMSIVEAAMPIFTKDQARYTLRLGFLKEAEDNRISQIKLRNILIFSLILVFLVSIKSIGLFNISNIRFKLLTSMSLVMLVLFFASSYAIRSWYSTAWLDSFITNKCINLSKALIPSTTKLIEENQFADFKNLIKIISDNDNLELVSVIKDDRYLYHTDSSKVGLKASGEYYRKSLNTDKISVFKFDNSGNYLSLAPVFNGKNRIGTLCTVWKNNGGYLDISYLRYKLSLIFVFAYLLLYMLIYLFTKETSNDELKESVNNSSSQERNTNNEKQKQQESSLSVSVFAYFSGLDEALQKTESGQITNSVKIIYKTAKELLPDGIANIELRQDGISVIFTDEFSQKSIYSAINFASSLREKLAEIQSLAFSPKITLNIYKSLCLKDEELLRKPLFVGNSLVDYKTISKIQSFDEIIISEELYNYIKELINFETLEILSTECGKFNTYIFNNFKETKELLNIFDSSTEKWTKLMILRILKERKEYENINLEELINNCDSSMKEDYLKII